MAPKIWCDNGSVKFILEKLRGVGWKEVYEVEDKNILDQMVYRNRVDV